MNLRIRHLSVAVLGVVAFAAAEDAAHGSVVYTASGVSDVGVAVEFQAEFTISGDTLTVELRNNSAYLVPPSSTLNPNDTIGSFYFDILDSDDNRPSLTYTAATGDVYLTDKDAIDTLSVSGANLVATAAGDNTWQFKDFSGVGDIGQSPFLAFGIGTVGNNTEPNSVAPNNFQGSIVGGSDYAIYSGDITTQNLDGRFLVKDRATYTWTGLSGFTEGDIGPTVAFGLGTAPDSLLQGTVVPEPTALAIWAGAGGLGFAVAGVRRRKGRWSKSDRERILNVINKQRTQR